MIVSQEAVLAGIEVACCYSLPPEIVWTDGDSWAVCGVSELVEDILQAAMSV